MDPIQAIEEKLGKYPHVVFRRTREGIQIDPPNDGGFSIAIEWHNLNKEWAVFCGHNGMHVHFDVPEDMMEFVAFALSEDCELQNFYRGGKPAGSTIRNVRDGRYETFGLIFYAFWRRRTVRTFRNRLIPSEPGDGHV